MFVDPTLNPKYNWQVTAKKALYTFLKAGAVALATQASMIPDSAISGILTEMGVPTKIVLPLMLVGLPAFKALVNWAKNR